MKIRTVGAQLFHADGRTDTATDMTKLIVAFRNFARAPKKQKKKNNSRANVFALNYFSFW